MLKISVTLVVFPASRICDVRKGAMTLLSKNLKLAFFMDAVAGQIRIDKSLHQRFIVYRFKFESTSNQNCNICEISRLVNLSS